VKDSIVKVLIVDDSALMRNLIGRIIDSSPDCRVVGKAMNGLFALQKIPKLNPEVIILDLEMPEMNGIEFLKEKKRRKIDIPVIILSSIAKRGAQITIEALSLGASDFIMKPSGEISEDINKVGDNLIRLVRSLGFEYKKNKKNTGTYEIKKEEKKNITISSVAYPDHAEAGRVVNAPPVRNEFIAQEHREHSPIDIIAIGISTGGPNALRSVFSRLSPVLQTPIVVVQHMPAGFTGEFAKSLNKICPLTVKEAEDGDILKSDRVLVCPGNVHMTVEKKTLAGIVHLSDDPPVNSHRPSVDVLFKSVAESYGDRSLAIIMTGMGKDGAVEIGSIRKKGGITVGQDEASSIVFGMPRVAWELGHLQYQIPLERIADTISDVINAYNKLPTD
jgi:two-component system, chemotaxis family, protein-glutamate methylesterase/glutaminase